MAPQRDEVVRAAVAAEQSLIGDAVGTALDSRGFSTTPVHWPGGGVPLPRSGEHFDVGLLVSDLDRWQRVRASGVLLRGLSIPWAVLTGAPSGPLWGAAYEHGATVVLPSTTALDEVVETLRSLARGESPVPARERTRLRAEWRHLRDDREQMRARARSLTPREREVLLLLYEGAPILEIATLLEISASTVRSQMKAIRRKLGVTSQLAAVAAYGSLIEPDPALPPVRS
ncbi:LuxR C-terminal-related transcriptional regulator [Nocardioides sp. BP30]|uniref:helix-turn-helix transcriptional regulator n=1 Tax=Nocardioides sp. BP30 TaxID=3036374 RepID=UPI002468B8DE|nr:LuxR C-terminal-related transcriptional regulator [Nocardioides sp. BP30]WGL51777.1 LuxR C-terminal-related transcriptional regulator [Nocardioides sp. BP30]